MNAKQEAKLNMYRVVEQFCDDNAGIVSTVAAFQTAFTNFKAKIAALIAGEQASALPLTGIAIDKTVSKQELAELATDVASLIYAYADATGNNTLREEVNFPYTKLFATRDDLLAPRCQNIYAAGIANKAEVEPYGLKMPQLDTFQAAITAYSAKIPTPRTAVNARKAQNANIRALFVDADAILKGQMDKIVVAFKAANPNFVTGYESNRVIIDPATTTTKIMAKVSNLADGTPIKDAEVTATGTSGPATGTVKTVTTSEFGTCILKPIPHGDYTVTIKATGFKDFTQTQFEAKLGTNNHLDAAMEAS